MFDDNAIVRWYSYFDGSCKLMRVMYSCDENGTITLGNVNEVRIAYEDVATIDETGVGQATATEAPVVTETVEEPHADETTMTVDAPVVEEPTVEPTPVVEEPTVTVMEEEPATPVVEEPTPTEPVVDAACDTNIEPAQVANAEVTELNEKVSVENEQTEEENSGSTSFAESERAELESLKREKKVNLIDSYKTYLSDEEYNEFISTVDNFSDESLEVALLKKRVDYAESSNSKPMRAFALRAPVKNDSADSLDSFVRKNLGC